MPIMSQKVSLFDKFCQELAACEWMSPAFRDRLILRFQQGQVDAFSRGVIEGVIEGSKKRGKRA